MTVTVSPMTSAAEMWIGINSGRNVTTDWMGHSICVDSQLEKCCDDTVL